MNLLSQAHEKLQNGDFIALQNLILQCQAQFGQDHTEVIQLQAALAFHQENFSQSLQYFLQLNKQDPKKLEIIANIAICLMKLKLPHQAQKVLVDKFAMNPTIEWAKLIYQFHGNNHRHESLMPATKVLSEAIIAGTENNLYIMSLVADFWQDWDFDTADKIYQIAIKTHPQDIGLQNNYAVFCRDSHQSAKSVQIFEQLRAQIPNNAVINLNYAYTLLSNGSMDKGWELHEARYETGRVTRALSAFKGEEWQGLSQGLHAKNILIYAEQGFGEGLMFSRFIYNFAALPDNMKPNKIVVFCQLGLERLFHDSFGKYGVNFIATHPEWLDPKKFPANYDYHAPLLSLPHKFRIGNKVQSLKSPYLVANPRLIEKFRKNLQDFGKNKFKIGLIWSGNPRHHDTEAATMNRRRSMDFDLLLPLINNPKIACYSFQVGDGLAKAQAYFTQGKLFNCGEYSGDFADAAAMMHQMDLILSVDTSPCHLAGGLGKPIWLLNRYDSCWRWHMQGEETDLYPTMRIFRQITPFNWQSVMNQVIIALEQHINR